MNTPPHPPEMLRLEHLSQRQSIGPRGFCRFSPHPNGDQASFSFSDLPTAGTEPRVLVAGHGTDRRFGDVWRKAKRRADAHRSPRIFRRCRPYLRRSRRRCDQLFIFGQDMFAVGNRLLMAARYGWNSRRWKPNLPPRTFPRRNRRTKRRASHEHHQLHVGGARILLHINAELSLRSKSHRMWRYVGSYETIPNDRDLMGSAQPTGIGVSGAS